MVAMNNSAEWANKRVREEDSEADSADSKRIRVDSGEWESPTSPEAKWIQDDILGILDDSDPGEPAVMGLDSVIRSFEEEILVPPAVQDQSSVSGESQPGLWYLLEASDDELGLPPAGGSSGLEKKIEAAELEPYSPGFFGHGGGGFGFDDDIQSFGIGMADDFTTTSNSSEFLMLDGLFDHSDQRYESADFSDVLWQQKSLPAV